IKFNFTWAFFGEIEKSFKETFSKVSGTSLVAIFNKSTETCGFLGIFLEHGKGATVEYILKISFKQQFSRTIESSSTVLKLGDFNGRVYFGDSLSDETKSSAK